MQFIAVQCSVVQYIAVQCSVVNAVQCNAVQFSAVQCSAVKCSAMQCSAELCGAVHCSAVQCCAVIFRVITRKTFHYLTICDGLCDPINFLGLVNKTLKITFFFKEIFIFMI